MKYSKTIAYVLIIIGALNWGVYGVLGSDVVDVLLGGVPVLARIVYVLVGLSGVYLILNQYSKSCCGCECASGCSDADGCCNSKGGATCSIEEHK